MITKKSSESKSMQKPVIPDIRVKIRLNDYTGSNILASATANIGGYFAVHGIKVINSQKGIFISMPQNSYIDSARETKYREIFHPI